MKGAPIKNAMAAARAFLAERKNDLPVADHRRSAPTTTSSPTSRPNKAELADGGREDAGDGRGHAHLRRAHRSRRARRRSKGSSARRSCSSRTAPTSEATPLAPKRCRRAADANVRVISVGLSSPQYDPETLKSARAAHRRHVRRGGEPRRARSRSSSDIGQQLSSEYELTYRSLLPPEQKAVVAREGRRAARRRPPKYTTPALDLAPQGTFETSWIDDVITSPWLMIFVDRRRSRAHRFRAPLRRRRPQPLAPAPHGAVRHRAERGRVAAAPRRGLGDARRHRAAHGRRTALVAAVRDRRRARRLQPLRARDRRLDDRRRHPRVDRRRDLLPVALGPAHRSRRAVRHAVHRLAPGLEDAQGIRGAARRQPRRARRRDAHRATRRWAPSA